MDTPMQKHSLSFPSDFIWGTATSAYQIEGSVKAGGRGESIWDLFCSKPGAIRNNQNGDVACDHFSRWEQDIALMSRLGIRAYRFSFAWPRIIPEGRGKTNLEGLDFYDRLIDALLEKGIMPLATLYHWDLPSQLQRYGGWASREIVDDFVHYALVCFNRFMDRVSDWITINEPWVISMLGYRLGVHAPGIADLEQSLSAAHYLLLSHGMAVREMKARAKNGSTRIGIALNINPVFPENPARQEDCSAAEQHGLLLNDFFLEPIYKGNYPESVLKLYPYLSKIVQDGDLKAIQAPLDFLGINYYTRSVIRGLFKNKMLEGVQCHFPNPHSAMMWEFYPDGLEQIVDQVCLRYSPKEILITENGTALSNEENGSSVISDDKRIEFIQSHLQAVCRLLKKGLPISGYFVWSFLDNFEWTHGYEKRFGLVHVDFDSLKRTLKKSALWYGQLCKSNQLHIA